MRPVLRQYRSELITVSTMAVGRRPPSGGARRGTPGDHHPRPPPSLDLGRERGRRPCQVFAARWPAGQPPPRGRDRARRPRGRRCWVLTAIPRSFCAGPVRAPISPAWIMHGQILSACATIDFLQGLGVAVGHASLTAPGRRPAPNPRRSKARAGRARTFFRQAPQGRPPTGLSGDVEVPVDPNPRGCGGSRAWPRRSDGRFEIDLMAPGAPLPKVGPHVPGSPPRPDSTYVFLMNVAGGLGRPLSV